MCILAFKSYFIKYKCIPLQLVDKYPTFMWRACASDDYVVDILLFIVPMPIVQHGLFS
jgi:hypothetical protein